uniref:SctD/MshK family protein n=1 Tax=Halomonas sp. TaxID=1486246 RepID=UPI0026072136|nr:EscD/YscD/HrpQ family type III secretion system periplasmic domain-containing protein [Halomonas sp.]
MSTAFMTSFRSLFAPVTDVYSTLEVTDGFHRGVTIPVEQPVCRIGSSSQSDVMLSDTGVAAEHVTLRFHARMVAIEATGGDVTVGGKVLTQGTGWRTNLPVTFEMGDAKLQLSQPELSLPPIMRLVWETIEPAWRATRQSVPALLAKGRTLSQRGLAPLRRPLAAAALTVSGWLAKIPLSDAWRARLQRLLPRRSSQQRDATHLKRNAIATVLAVVVLSVLGAGFFGAGGKAGATITATALQTTAMLHPQTADATLMLADLSRSPAEALQNRLTEAGLNDLQVEDAGNHLVVSGEFAPHQHADWQAVQRWFDESYGSRQVLISNAMPGVTPDHPDFRFQAVWLGDNPYVIGDNGERLYPGAALQQGWVLAEIANDRLTLRRGEDEMFLTL